MTNKNQIQQTMDDIVEALSYTGYMACSEENKERYYRVIPKLVEHDVIQLTTIASTGRKTNTVIKRGGNYLKVKFKGCYRYIKQVERDINPPRWYRFWNYISTNPLLSTLVASSSGFIGWQLFRRY